MDNILVSIEEDRLVLRIPQRLFDNALRGFRKMSERTKILNGQEVEFEGVVIKVKEVDFT